MSKNWGEYYRLKSEWYQRLLYIFELQKANLAYFTRFRDDMNSKDSIFYRRYLENCDEIWKHECRISEIADSLDAQKIHRP